mmetsp:Transcript_23200/g.53863  ORF Transcript_23200/g.53863 Transcript_23200/m.53863 type:complete len:82 (-) Transcript_23200:10-255(-)
MTDTRILKMKGKEYRSKPHTFVIPTHYQVFVSFVSKKAKKKEPPEKKYIHILFFPKKPYVEHRFGKRRVDIQPILEISYVS